MPELSSILEQDKRRYRFPTSSVGTHGETLAADFLRNNGFRIVMSNFRVPIGRNIRGAEVTGEIDLIALDDDTLCFIEVKTRTIDGPFKPSDAVTLRKQRQVIRTARVYRRVFCVRSIPYRYDVVSIVVPSRGEPSIELAKDFWSESRFRNKRWDRPAWDDFL